MELVRNFLFILLTAALMQNTVFARAMGIGRETTQLSSPEKIFLFGGSLTYVAFFSALLTYPLALLCEHFIALENQTIARYLLAILMICLVYLVSWLVTRRFLPVVHYYIRELFAAATFNCAVLGTVLITYVSNYSFAFTLVYAVGSGIGYTLALLLIHEGNRRIALSDIPRSFRRLPITILYIGILSLAIYGLIGHQLPT